MASSTEMKDQSDPELTEGLLAKLFDAGDDATHLLQVGRGLVTQVTTDAMDANASVASSKTNSSTHHADDTSLRDAEDEGATNEDNSELQDEALPLHVHNNSHWYFGVHASSGNPLFAHTWKGVFMDTLVFCLLATPPIAILTTMRLVGDPGEGKRLISNIKVKTSIHASFAFVNGWVNVIMMVRYRMFATMMVGNTIMMGTSYVCSFHKDDMNGSCPRKLRDVSNYAILISMFVLGAMAYGFIDKRWNSQKEYLYFGILFVAACVWDELFVADGNWDLYIYSPLFGAAGAIAQNGGLGGVPWAATGNILKAGYHSSRYLADGLETDAEVGLSQVVLWISFLTGILLGCSLESEFALMYNCCSLACIFYLLGEANPKELPRLETHHHGDD
eukprot:TRINITY_DN2642_c1_g1_i1.p1 TRINITY_DN2642_c1_g1~~TRINITY_DN2642_c1_g1_i1.p1  ORF type:complete len:421 (-),score=71.45 TRINITY_DN2642_c1_g1_i1:180-1349(-)